MFLSTRGARRRLKILSQWENDNTEPNVLRRSYAVDLKKSDESKWQFNGKLEKFCGVIICMSWRCRMKLLRSLYNRERRQHTRQKGKRIAFVGEVPEFFV